MQGSVFSLLDAHLRAGNSRPCQRFQVRGGWESRSYAQLNALTNDVAATLVGVGIRAKDRVAILAPTRADWSVVDLATIGIGAVLVPIYPTSTAPQILDILKRTDAKALVVELGRELPPLPGWVKVLSLGEHDGDLGDLRSSEARPEAAEQAIQLRGKLTQSDLCSIVFSSGSTGVPKGCLLTHGNFESVVRAAAAFELGGRSVPAHREAAFVYLPLAHASARLQQFTTFALGGELIYGGGGTAELMAQIEQVQPTFVSGVPRFFESVFERLQGSESDLRTLFGPRLVYALTGGAPISSDLLGAYRRAGVMLLEGYGLTETTTALTLSSPEDERAGSVGRALPGVRLWTDDRGEVLARGANMFVGYLGDTRATAEVFRGEWFRTGDIGRIDADGYLYITGRLKNLLVTSTGKKVAPEPVENALRTRTGIADVLLVGDGRPYLTALFAAPKTKSKMVLEAVRVSNSRVSPPERIRRIALVDTTFTVEGGEITASGKLRRSEAVCRNQEVIAALYADRARIPDVLDVSPLIAHDEVGNTSSGMPSTKEKL